LHTLALVRGSDQISPELASSRVSVGICAYNEESNVGKLLENLIMQPLPKEFRLEEIIVVSSGSTDRTTKIVSELSSKDQRIRLITEEERNGKAQALNVLLDNATGDIIVVVSADTRPAKGAIAKLVESMKPRIGGACSRTLPINGSKNVMENCYWFLWKVHNRVLQQKSLDQTLAHLGGDMWAIRRGIVQHIPPDVINDDAYLGITLKKKGWKIAFVPDSQVLIKSPSTPLEYIRQRERIVIGHKQLEQVTGVQPTTIGALALKKPLFSMRLVLDEFRTQNAKRYPSFLVGFFLEAVAQTLARMNFKKKSAYLKWIQIRSTKTI
jgi:cellulose synthase/poly-beta-1,6-N-acetylglucosamine synthase-like glycosyltransferase